MQTTLNEIKNHRPCEYGWGKLLNYLGKTKADDEPLSFKDILKSNGIEDAVWALRVLDYDDRCLFQADVAESVLHIYEGKYPDDDRPRKAIRAIREYKAGNISKRQLKEAAAAIYAADAVVAAAAIYAVAADAADAVAVAAAAIYAAVAAAAADVYASTYDAKKSKWAEIEHLFIKHFC